MKKDWARPSLGKMFFKVKLEELDGAPIVIWIIYNIKIGFTKSWVGESKLLCLVIIAAEQSH